MQEMNFDNVEGFGPQQPTNQLGHSPEEDVTTYGTWLSSLGAGTGVYLRLHGIWVLDVGHTACLWLTEEVIPRGMGCAAPGWKCLPTCRIHLGIDYGTT